MTKLGATPLMMAVQNDNLEVLAALIDLGADPSLRSIGGRSPLEAARAAENAEAAAILEALEATHRAEAR